MARFKRQRDRQNQLATAKAALRATATRAVPDEDRQREIGLLELQTAVRALMLHRGRASF